MRLAILGILLALGAPAESSAQPTAGPQPGAIGAPVQSVIRISGSGLAGLLLLWEQDFASGQPGVRFENHLASGDAAIGALEAGAADIAVNGREPMLTEFLSFVEVFGNDGPFQVTVAT